MSNADEVRSCSGSCYYPLEMSEVLRYVQENDAKYAIVGLPCFVKALRLASLGNQKLAERFVFIAGLVCAGLKSKFLAEYLINLAGGDTDKVKHVSFREKEPGLTAREPMFTYRYDPDSSNPDGKIQWTKACGSSGANHFFQLNACNYCDDVFAELADAVFMDAWLPEYERDGRGTSLVLTRSRLATDILHEGISNGELSMENIPIEKLVSSQRPVIKCKREKMAMRLYLSKKWKRKVPRKRVSPAFGCAYKEAIAIRQAFYFQDASSRAWVKSEGNLSAFYKEMPLYRALIGYAKASTIINRVRGGLKGRLMKLTQR